MAISRRTAVLHVRHIISRRCAKSVFLGLLLISCGLAFFTHGPASVFISSFLPVIRPCNCLRNVQMEVRHRNKVWVPRDGDEECKERCATIVCEDCDAPMDMTKRQDCAMSCSMHGSCPRSLPMTPDQIFECPPYHAFPKEDYLAVLRSLGATIRPYPDHPGIEVRGVTLQAPHLLHNQSLWCAVQHLIYDFKLVVFKDQEGGKCATDYEYCKAVADRTMMDGDMASMVAKMWLVSNHPLLGLTIAHGDRWHYDGRAELCSTNVWTVLTSSGKRAGTQFVATGGVVADMSSTEAEFWSRMWWRSPYNHTHSFPVIFTHPVTNERVVYLVEASPLGWDLDRASGSLLGEQESRARMDELTGLLGSSQHAFNVTWAVGDVGFVDNIAMMHRALPGIFDHFDAGGLRLIRHGICGCRLNSRLRAASPVFNGRPSSYVPSPSTG